MAIDGTALRDIEFKDPETGLRFKVTITMIDAIHLKLLERIAEALEKIKIG